MKLFRPAKQTYTQFKVKDSETDYVLKILDKHKATHVSAKNDLVRPITVITYLSTKHQQKRIEKDLRYYRIKTFEQTQDTYKIFD